jgi:hypothetical protein
MPKFSGCVNAEGRRIGPTFPAFDPGFATGEELAFGKVIGCGDELEAEDLRVDPHPAWLDEGMQVLHHPVVKEAAGLEVRREPCPAPSMDRTVSKERTGEHGEMSARPDDAARLRTGLLDPTVIVLAQDPQDVAHRMDRPLLLTLLGDAEPCCEVREHHQALRDSTDLHRRRRQPGQQRRHVAVDRRQAIPEVVPNPHGHQHSLPAGVPRDQQHRIERSDESATNRLVGTVRRRDRRRG